MIIGEVNFYLDGEYCLRVWLNADKLGYELKYPKRASTVKLKTDGDYTYFLIMRKMHDGSVNLNLSCHREGFKRIDISKVVEELMELDKL